MRRCIRCEAEITECFGSVLARDMIRYENKEISTTSIREHCGRCVMVLIAYEYGGHGSREETQQYLRSIPEIQCLIIAS